MAAQTRLWVAALCLFASPFGEGFTNLPVSSFCRPVGSHIPSRSSVCHTRRGGLRWLLPFASRREQPGEADPLGAGISVRMNAGESVSTLFADRVLLGSEFSPAEVKIQGSRIASVRRMTRAEWEAEGSSGHDVGGKHAVVPAFINSHTHLSMACIRGAASATDFEGNVVEDMFFRFEGNLHKDDVRAFTRMGCWEALMHGVGCAFDHYYFAPTLVEAFKDTGMSGVIAPTLQDIEGPGLMLPGCNYEDTLQATLDIHHDKALRDEHGIVAAIGAHATDTVSKGLWERVASLSSDEGLPIHAHVAQSIEEFERCQERHGMTPVQHLKDTGILDCGSNLLLVHAMYLSDADVKLLSPSKHLLGLCPSSAIQFGFPCDYPAWTDAGLKICLGTDAACSNDGMNVQQEMRSLGGGSVFGVHTSPEMVKFGKSGSLADAKKVQDVRQRILTRAAPVNRPHALLDTVGCTPSRPQSPCPRPQSSSSEQTEPLLHPCTSPSTCRLKPAHALPCNCNWHTITCPSTRGRLTSTSMSNWRPM